MHLSKPELFQMKDEWLKKLPAELLLEGLMRLLHDVKELQDRLKQNPDNSSRPPTSQPPWAKTGGAAAERGTADAAAETAGSSTEETEQAPPVDAQRSLIGKRSGQQPGSQPGSAGHGRKLAITAPTSAQLARQRCRRMRSRRLTAWDEVDMAPPVEGVIGLTFSVTRHTLLEVSCSCGHVSRAQPWRAPAGGQWERRFS